MNDIVLLDREAAKVVCFLMMEVGGVNRIVAFLELMRKDGQWWRHSDAQCIASVESISRVVSYVKDGDKMYIVDR